MAGAGGGCSADTGLGLLVTLLWVRISESETIAPLLLCALAVDCVPTRGALCHASFLTRNFLSSQKENDKNF